MRRLRRFLLLLAMVGFGIGVNRWIAVHKTNLTTAATTPDKAQALINLPGTLYVTQNGILYTFRNGRFTSIPLPTTDQQHQSITWSQPVALPSGNLLAVARGAEYSDLYEVNEAGKIVAQLTKNYVSSNPDVIRNDHWIAWPHLSADGNTLFFSLDSPKQYNSYEVDFNIWSTPITTPLIVSASTRLTNGTVHGQHWTTPNFYTGGDTNPIPLSNGKLLYVTYGNSGNLKVEATVDLQATPKAKSIQLTTPEQNCNAVTLSPDQTQVAMICSPNNQQTQLEVASFDGTTLGTPRVLVQNCLCASPQWRSDGGGLVYFAPTGNSGHFQLWWLSGAAGKAPAQPKQVTDSLDFDATSVPSWSAVGTQAVAPN